MDVSKKATALSTEELGACFAQGQASFTFNDSSNVYEGLLDCVPAPQLKASM